MEALNDWLRQTPVAAYLSILVMTAVIYKVAFARKLPILKSLIVYLVLAFGCVLFWFLFILRFPIIEILLVTVVMIVIARIRMWMTDRKQKSPE
ncbi:YlaH-like family protein [Paludifilum halophilum]|uniref:YlaH-like protein n=1 Tax=Paludifilum halophilum TaxID=1642702 RepID=A0A235B6G0_9BACL|nr:YlaH-like family protein [Paludifilum halophilum]OYD07822.1 hypothetical protein CHM34_10220 [Paludifilum halophilum]